MKNLVISLELYHNISDGVRITNLNGKKWKSKKTRITVTTNHFLNDGGKLRI